MSITIQSSVIRFLLTTSCTTLLPVHSLSNMQTTFALAAMAAVAYAAPQGVTGDISPSGSPPAGFSTSYADSFQITAVNSTIVTKRDLSKVCEVHAATSLHHTDFNSVMPAQLLRDLSLSPLPTASSPTKMAALGILRPTTNSNSINPHRLEPSILMASLLVATAPLLSVPPQSSTSA